MRRHVRTVPLDGHRPKARRMWGRVAPAERWHDFASGSLRGALRIEGAPEEELPEAPGSPTRPSLSSQCRSPPRGDFDDGPAVEKALFARAVALGTAPGAGRSD